MLCFVVVISVCFGCMRYIYQYLFYHRRPLSHLPISFRVASQALGQSYDCPSASEITLNDMGLHEAAPNHNKEQSMCIILGMYCTVGTPYNTNVGVQKIPDRAIWKPVVAKRNNTNPWSCSKPQILVTRDSRQVHMAEQPASRDRLE